MFVIECAFKKVSWSSGANVNERSMNFGKTAICLYTSLFKEDYFLLRITENDLYIYIYVCVCISREYNEIWWI